MASNFNKAERYVKQGDEYKLLSYATSSESVEMSDGTDLETKMDNIEEEIDTKIDSVKIGTTEYKSGTTVTLPVYTKNEADSTFGADIALTIDTSTYKMTLELKDNKGQILSSKEIDFPIESMVVNASYANGTLTLTLQNGNDINVDISSIISGLVPDTRTIAGVDLKDNITATELRTALNVASGANNYTHPDSGVTAGTYRSVTVNKQGHVTAGSNPTVTIAQGGTGATDAATARTNLGITPANIGALSTSGDSKSNTVTFTSSDVSDGSATAWTSVSALTSGITHATFFARVSQMFKNVRYLYKMLGTTDISSIGNGTVTNAISTLNSNFVRLFASTDLAGNGTIPNFTDYKWFIIVVSASGFYNSHFIDINCLQDKNMTFVSSYYYNPSLYAYASISLDKNGKYTIGQGFESNSVSSSVSVWGKK